MGKQLTIHLKPEHDLTYDEWRSFVEEKHGKYRGVNTEEAVAALRKHIDGERDPGEPSEASNGAGEGLDYALLEKLLGEIRALRRENRQLREQLVELAEGGTPGVTLLSHDAKTKNGGNSATADSADSGGRPGTTDVSEGWSWSEYVPDDFKGEIPEEALETLHKAFDPIGDEPSAFDGRELTPVNPQHVTMPGEPADARVAAVAAILKYERETIGFGGVVARTMELLDNGTKGYVKRKLVEGRADAPAEHAVLDWLAGPHPDPKRDAEWVTRLAAYEELRAEHGERALSEAEDVARMFVGAALGYPQHMAAGIGGSPTVTGMREEFGEYRARLVEMGVLDESAAAIVERALGDLEERPLSPGRLANVPVLESWESFWDDWPTSPSELVAWWEAEQDSPLTDDERGRVLASLEEVAPSDDPRVPRESRVERDSDSDSDRQLEQIKNASPREETDETEANDNVPYAWGSREAAKEREIRRIEEELDCD